MASNTMLNSAIHAKRDANLVNNNNTVTYNSYGPQISLAPGPDPMTILQERVAFSALFDSAERFDAPKCHPETRTAVLSLIDQWAKDQSEGYRPVFWLTGAAGAGKSAIAQTLVEKWKQEGLAILSFFFWRTSSERNHKTKLVPTLSYQLSKHHPSAQVVIEGTVRSGDIFKKNMQIQVEELLLRPLENIPPGQPPAIIVIDGLDECCADIPPTADFAGQDFKSQQREILDAIAFACQQTHTPRFLIVSRPEQAIRESFESPRLQKMTNRLSLNDAPNAKEDILLFLRCCFEEMRRKYPSLPLAWPGEDKLSELVKRSSGQFIYPSTVVRYITHRRQYPEKSLQEILNLTTRANGDQHPLAELDALYTLILESISAESLDTVRFILGILCYLSTLTWRSEYNDLNGSTQEAHRPWVLDKLLFLSHGEVNAHLTDLHSILYIPPTERPNDTIRFLHATISQYLKDQSRSKSLHIARASFLPSLFTLIFRHLTTGKREAESDIAKMPVDEFGMYYYVRICLFEYGRPQKVYSKEIRNALWKFLEDEIGSYASLTINPRFNSKFGLYTGDCTSCGHAHHVDLYIIREAITVLERYNIPKVEPSLWRRFWVRRRLKKAKLILGKQIDALTEAYKTGGVSGSNELGDMEDEAS